MNKKTATYPFIFQLVQSWKPRAKEIKINLKDIAIEAGIAPQHLTKLICGKIQNPSLRTINNIEMTLQKAEQKGV